MTTGKETIPASDGRESKFPSNRVRILAASLLLIVLILFAYWLKCQLGISLFEKISLHAYFPFSHLQKNTVTIIDEPGMILADDFESRRWFPVWAMPWAKEKNSVVTRFARPGHESSQCLLINNNSTSSWDISHTQFVKVQKGDTFSISGFTEINGENVSARLLLTAFDKDKKAIPRAQHKEKTTITGAWEAIESEFTISEGTEYIKFSFGGQGRGEFKFDSLRFEKTSRTSVRHDPSPVHNSKNKVNKTNINTKS